jgi:hypothetical protein
MIDITTLPATVRQHLEKSNALARQVQEAESDREFTAAVTELARTAPDLAALLVAASMGRREIEATLIEKMEFYERVERSFLGFSVGPEFVPLTTCKTVTKRLVIK